mmetsp:Transcript_24831/g.83747  ORF Transcript_24831/g.83747 Transcript_24831/m.83747 type:complete len:242 (-) Transcript_24831:105-830(-)
MRLMMLVFISAAFLVSSCSSHLRAGECAVDPFACAARTVAQRSIEHFLFLHATWPPGLALSARDWWHSFGLTLLATLLLTSSLATTSLILQVACRPFTFSHIASVISSSAERLAASSSVVGSSAFLCAMRRAQAWSVPASLSRFLASMAPRGQFCAHAPRSLPAIGLIRSMHTSQWRYTSDARTSSVCALYAQIRDSRVQRAERGPLGVRNVCHVSTVVLAQRALTEETLDEAKSVKLITT